MRSARHRLRQLAALSAGELTTLIVAAVVLRIAPLMLRRHGLQGTQARLRRKSSPPGPPANPRETAMTVAHLVEVAAARGWPRPNCLHRSVTLWWLLLRRGVDTEIRIGVRRKEGGDGLDFHAWVEHEGLVINDARDVRTRFATFDRAIVPPKATFR